MARALGCPRHAPVPILRGTWWGLAFLIPAGPAGGGQSAPWLRPVPLAFREPGKAVPTHSRLLQDSCLLAQAIGIIFSTDVETEAPEQRVNEPFLAGLGAGSRGAPLPTWARRADRRSAPYRSQWWAAPGASCGS